MSVLHLFEIVQDFASPINLLVPLVVVALFVASVASTRHLLKRVPTCESEDSKYFATEFLKIEPLIDFDWRSEEPVKLRPFKKKYNLTMAIEKVSVNDLILMDNQYLERINMRKQIMRDHQDTVLASNPQAAPAVKELYEWLLSVYLPQRFPSMFQLIAKETRNPSFILNCVDGEKYPLIAPKSSIDALRTLGAIVEDDILFLIPSSDGDGYILGALVTCFPNGFDMTSKFNLKIRDIHKPVPRYGEKMEKSMYRYFDKMEVGKFVKRANWTISDKPIFTIEGNHLYEGEEVPKFQVDLKKVNMRCERQVLFRLPKTKVLVFSFKTFMYPIATLKEEGVGPDLIDAIDGLFKGNVPEMAFYKRAVEWAEPVKAYLRL